MPRKAQTQTASADEAQALPVVKTEGGEVAIDAGATYAVTVGRSVTYLGHVMRPRDKNIELRGDALLVVAAEFPGAFVNVSPIQ